MIHAFTSAFFAASASRAAGYCSTRRSSPPPAKAPEPAMWAAPRVHKVATKSGGLLAGAMLFTLFHLDTSKAPVLHAPGVLQQPQPLEVTESGAGDTQLPVTPEPHQQKGVTVTPLCVERL